MKIEIIDTPKVNKYDGTNPNGQKMNTESLDKVLYDTYNVGELPEITVLGTKRPATVMYDPTTGQYSRGSTGDILTPVNTSISDNPADWIFQDEKGILFTPNRDEQGDNTPVISSDDRTNGERLWSPVSNYFNEGIYRLQHPEEGPIGGKYTLPAIALASLTGADATLAGIDYAVAPIVDWMASNPITVKTIGTGIESAFLGEMLDRRVLRGEHPIYGKGDDILDQYVEPLFQDAMDAGITISGISKIPGILPEISRQASPLSELISDYTRKIGKQLNAEKRIARARETAQKYETDLNILTPQREAAWAEYKRTHNKILDRQNHIDSTVWAYKDQMEEAAKRQASQLYRRAKEHYNTTQRAIYDKYYNMVEPDVNGSRKLTTDLKVKRDIELKALQDAFNPTGQKIDFSKLSEADFLNLILNNYYYSPTKMGGINLSRGDRAFNLHESTANALQQMVNQGADPKKMLGTILDNEGINYINNQVTTRQGINLFSDITPKGFEAGNFEIPLFGTDDVVRGTITGVNPGTGQSFKFSDILNNTKYDSSQYTYGMITDWNQIPMKTTSSTSYKAEVPEEYVQALRHNIDYLKQTFPGSKEFGSSASAAYAGTPHSTHDIDLIISDTDFAANVESKFGPRTGNNWKVTRRDDTFTTQLDPKYGEAGSLDFNVIWTDPVTGMADANKGTVGREIFKQFFPKEYATAVQESLKTGQPLKINKTPKELIDAYDPVTKTIMDSFSSTKPKHMPRAEAHLTVSNPDAVEKALDLYAQEKLGGQARHLPITREMFTDVEANSRIFDELGYKGVDKETIINDPAKMKNLVDYWYIHNSIFGRGINDRQIPRNIINNYIAQGMTKEEATYQAIQNAMQKWDANSIGGSAYGAGLNTVTLGDSGHGNIYGYIQHDINVKGTTAEDIIHNTKRALGHSDYRFTPDEIKQISEIIGHDFKGNSPADLLNNIPVSQEGKIILQRLKDEMGIHALQSEKQYGHSKYTSMTGDLSPTDTYFMDNRTSMEIPPSDIQRDQLSFSNTSGVVTNLERDLRNLSTNWDDKKAAQIISQSTFGKEQQALVDAAKWFDKYTVSYNRAIKAVQKKYPKAFKELEKLKETEKKANEEYNTISEQIKELRHQANDWNGRIATLYNMAERLDRRKREFRSNILKYSILSSFVGGSYYIIYKSIKFNHDLDNAFKEAQERNNDLKKNLKAGNITQKQYDEELVKLANELGDKYQEINEDNMWGNNKRVSLERRRKIALWDLKHGQD